MPTVLSVQLHKTSNHPLLPVPRAQALLDHGLEGDSHSRRGPGRRRQVLLVDASTLERFGLRPGDLREQITVAGLPDISLLSPGTRLRIGEATFEAAGDCEPCLHIGDLLSVDEPELFRQALDKRRGLLCRVVDVRGQGWVTVGDVVELEPV